MSKKDESTLFFKEAGGEEPKIEERTYKDKILRNIYYSLVVIILLQVIFNFEKIIDFLNWVFGVNIVVTL